MVIDKFRSLFDTDITILFDRILPEFREISFLLLQGSSKNKKEIINRVYNISEKYKKLPEIKKQIYWKVTSNKFSLDELESSFLKIEQVTVSFNNLLSANNSERTLYLNVYSYINPNRDPGKQADAMLLTVSHANELENLKRDSLTNPEALRILENYKIISNAGFGLNSVQILEEAKFWNETIKNNPNVPEAVIFQILSDLVILPSQIEVHLKAYTKLQSSNNFPADIIAERDKELASPELKSRYVSLLIHLEAKSDLRKKEFKEIYRDSQTDFSFDCQKFANKELNHSTPDIVKREILSVKALFDLLKNSKVSETNKIQIRNILEFGRNFEYGLYQIQQVISMTEPVSISPQVISRMDRLSRNLSVDEKAEIVDFLRNIEALPMSVKSVVKKFLNKSSTNAKEVYEEGRILKMLINSCYEPVPNSQRRVFLNILIEYNLRPSEIKRRLGL